MPEGGQTARHLAGCSALSEEPQLAGRNPAQITRLLIDWRGGDQAALDQLIPLVHDELRRLARRHMAHERAGHTLQATALVKEAFVRLIDVRQVKWQDRRISLRCPRG
jgi:hypothetical protein